MNFEISIETQLEYYIELNYIYIVQLQCHWHLFRFFLQCFALLCFVSVGEIDFSGFDMRFCVMNPDQNAISSIRYFNSTREKEKKKHSIIEHLVTEIQPDIKLFRFRCVFSAGMKIIYLKY